MFLSTRLIYVIWYSFMCYEFIMFLIHSKENNLKNSIYYSSISLSKWLKELKQK